MRAYETFNKIFNQLQTYESELNTLDGQIQTLANQCRQEQSAVEPRIQAEIDALNAYRPRINAFIAIARAHAGNLYKPSLPRSIDINKLSRLSIQIDNSKQRDPNAEALYTEASAQLLMIDRTIQEKRNKIRQDQVQISRKYEQMQATAINRKNRITNEVAAFLRSGPVKELAEQLDLNRTLFLFGPIDEVLQNEQFGDYVSLGEILCVLPAPAGAVPILKELLGEFYNGENHTVNLPFYVKIPQEITLYQYSEDNEALTLSALQMLIINTARYFNRFRNVVFIDPVRYNNSALDDLAPLSEGKRSFIEKVPTSAKEVEDVLDCSLGQINRPDALCDLSGKVFIFHCFPQGYSSSAVEKIRQLCANAERFNLTIILTHQLDKNGSGNNGPIQSIKSLSYNRVLLENKDIHVNVSEDIFNAKLYVGTGGMPPELVEKFLTKQVEELGNDYGKRIGFPQEIVYRKGIRYLDNIPLGIDSEGNIVSVDLENSNFATFICGAARSGKSTLLHTLITSVVQNTHPDDVEIWLIDFKMTEFSRYIDYMPPHVRYIMLDESPELVYDIIDRLTEILQKRQNMFKGKWQKLYEVPPEKYMPAMLVIIDEFSIMSQIIADAVANSSENYKAKVQALLAKGAALGMHFIFASQGFTSGTSGLTDFSKKQIQQRIAMKTEYLEIKETLDLKSTSEEDQFMMEQLAVHHALIRIPVDAKGNHLLLTKVLYISDYSKQEALIERINQSFTPAKRYDPSDPSVYINKKPMVIDGNCYLTWMDKLPEIQKRLEDYHESFGEGVLLFPGEPRRMTPTFPIEIADSYCENVLIVAPSKEKMATASMLMSMMESAQLQDCEVAFWASKRNAVFQQIRVGCNRTEMRSFMDLESICGQIRRLRDRIRNEHEDNVLVFLVGFEALILDMSYQKSKSIGEDFPLASGVVTTDKAGNKLYYQSRDENSLDLLQRMKMLGMDLGDEDEAEAVGADQKFVVDHQHNSLLLDRNQVSTDSQVYDAREDLEYILTNGPRMGYHFVMLFSTAGEIEKSKVDTRLFKHKLLFRDTKQNAIMVFGTSDSSIKDLEDHCFRYSNGLDACSYRPYLHRGLSWDGWVVDDSGCAIHEEEEEDYLL